MTMSEYLTRRAWRIALEARLNPETCRVAREYLTRLEQYCGAMFSPDVAMRVRKAKEYLW